MCAGGGEWWANECGARLARVVGLGMLVRVGEFDVWRKWASHGVCQSEAAIAWATDRGSHWLMGDL